MIDALFDFAHELRHGHSPRWGFVPIAPDWLISLRYCTICHPEPEPEPVVWPEPTGPRNDFQIFKDAFDR